MKMRVDLKRITPLGAVIILAASAAAIVMSFTVRFEIPERYESLHEPSYYTQNAETMGELLAELRVNVFPGLRGITDSYVAEDGKTIIISVKSGEHDKVKAVLLRDFDETLFKFVKK